MNKMQMAHDMALAIQGTKLLHDMELVSDMAWKYADAMQAKADKRNKAEAEQKRKEVREILSDANTFIEREGQHFDDVEWQPDWSQAPDGYNWWAADQRGCYWYDREPEWIDNEWGGYTINKNNRIAAKQISSFGYIGNWKNSLRNRPEPKCEVDWSQAPEWAKYWMIASNGAADWLSDHPSGDPLKVKICHASSFNYQGNWQDSLRKRPQ